MKCHPYLQFLHITFQCYIYIGWPGQTCQLCQGDGYDHCLPQRHSVGQVCNVGEITKILSGLIKLGWPCQTCQLCQGDGYDHCLPPRYLVGQVCNIGDITNLLRELIKPDQGDGYDHCLPPRYLVEQVCNIGDIVMLFCVVQSTYQTNDEIEKMQHRMDTYYE